MDCNRSSFHIAEKQGGEVVHYIDQENEEEENGVSNEALDGDMQQAISASLDDYAHQLQLEEVIAYSDAVYASELQLEEAIIASSNLTHARPSSNNQDCYEEDDYDSTQGGSGKRSGSDDISGSSPKRSKVESSDPVVNVLCGICLEKKNSHEIFNIEGCFHSFCHGCIGQHVISKLQEKMVPIVCPEPNCAESLAPEQCEEIIPRETIDKWRSVLVEADIPDSEKYYCPYKDCSALMVRDFPEVGTSTEADIREAVCQDCRRLFCAQCGVPWHAGLECEEFQRLSPSERGQDDVRFMSLAKEKQWQRCPKCRRVVERESGCPHIVCRCRFEFCYKCGSEWKKDRLPCKCPGWEEDE